VARFLRTHHPPAGSGGVVGADGTVAATLLLGIAAFQVCLAAGAPWGVASYGGSHTGVLPASLRSSSAVASGVYVALAAVAGTRLVDPLWRRRVLTIAAPVLGLGTLLNLVSPSMVERLIWTPVTAVLSVTLWRARGSRPPRRVDRPVAERGAHNFHLVSIGM
jgi:hypothetical protein